jgi:hypothetical protein
MLAAEGGLDLSWQLVKIGCHADFPAPSPRHPRTGLLGERDETRDRAARPRNHYLLASSGTI